MIRIALPLHPKSGTTLDLTAPVIVCDHCGKFIDKDRPGNLLWGRDDPVQFHVHKACDYAFRHVPWSRDIDEWLAQLLYNYNHPLQVDGGVDVTLPWTGDVFHVYRWKLDGSPSLEQVVALLLELI